MLQPSDHLCGPSLDLSNRTVSFLLWRPQRWKQYSAWDFKRVERGRITPWPAGHSSFDAAQDTIDCLGCELTFLGYVELLISQNPPKGTKIKGTPDLRDPKPQKPDRHWDTDPVGESYMSALSLGFFVDVHLWPLYWSHDAEQSRPLVWSNTVTLRLYFSLSPPCFIFFFPPVLYCCYTASTRDI